MTIEFLIATMNQKNDNFLKSIFKNLHEKDVLATVINQCTSIIPTEIKTTYSGVKIISISDIGLSKSRNLALLNATADICVICDDDVIYKKNILSELENIFLDVSLDVARFEIQTPDGYRYKNYPLEQNNINIRKALTTSSIEIAVRRKSIQTNKIIFDEYFGLGGYFRGSEDVIFISDCVKNKLNVHFFPIPLVIHPLESSGTDYRKGNSQLIVTIGAAFTRIFGRNKGLFVILVFLFKRYKYYKGIFTMKDFLTLMLHGRNEFNKKSQL